MLETRMPDEDTYEMHFKLWPKLCKGCCRAVGYCGAIPTDRAEVPGGEVHALDARGQWLCGLVHGR